MNADPTPDPKKEAGSIPSRREQDDLTVEELETRKRMRREAAIMALLVVIIAALFFMQRWLLQAPSEFPSVTNLFFFGLINLNVILICVLLFLILRNLAKLLFDRRQRVLGSALRTKLVAAFSGFALVPTVIMFYAAWTFVTSSINSWFSVKVETSLSESLEVAKSYYSTFEDFARFHARGLAESIAARRHGPPSDAGAPLLFDYKTLRDFLEAKQAEYNLHAVDVFIAGQDTPYFSTRRWVEADVYRGATKDFLEPAGGGRVVTEIHGVGDRAFVRAAAPIVTGNEVRGLVVTTYAVSAGLVGKMEGIRRAYEEYRQVMLVREPVMSSYIVIFALISAFIFFSATWFGFFLARGIAVPIQKLADATGRVAAGDLDVRIAYPASDEMGRLIQSFNRMIEDLRGSRAKLDAAADELRDSNLELEQRRQYMETVLSNITAGVISFSADGRISTINRRARDILGLSDEVIGEHYREAFAAFSTPAQIEEFTLSLETGARGFVEREVDAKIAGETRTILVRLTVLPEAPAGAAISAVMVLDDVTELIKAKRVAAWREIARRIAHEIKNPLTPIQLAAQRLRKRYSDRFEPETDQAFFESTATIIRQVGEMKRMVQEFSDFARMADVLPEPNQLNDIVAETVALYAEAHSNIGFEFEPDATLPPILLDRAQVKRVFINLFDNAIDSITGPGTITIRTARDPRGDEVVVDVIDTGAGLPMAYRQRIFEPYFSTKKMGTGLGLAIVHQIMTDHGGRIELADNRPRGTIARLVFPLRPAVGDAKTG
ncbi:HAMP domain-containing protein [bacterium]|nr:HAMP domain-containing protein [bacterium]